MMTARRRPLLSKTPIPNRESPTVASQGLRRSLFMVFPFALTSFVVGDPSKAGATLAFTTGQRYVSWEKLKAATRTSDRVPGGSA